MHARCGEVEAVPVLIRRVAGVVAPGLRLRVPRPIRVKRDEVLRPEKLGRAVELAARQAGRNGAIFLLINADDDCPAALAPAILRQATEARSDMLIGVVLAKCEYEAWILAAAESLRGHRTLARDLSSPGNPEAIRGAKQWLSRHMTGPHGYTETLDQAALTNALDLNAARRASSFDKCYRELERILFALGPAHHA